VRWIPPRTCSVFVRSSSSRSSSVACPFGSVVTCWPRAKSSPVCQGCYQPPSSDVDTEPKMRFTDQNVVPIAPEIERVTQHVRRILVKLAIDPAFEQRFRRV